jgi:UDP-glucose 4-epimerase
MATIFITGAAGFIGSNAADSFLNDGHSVIGWDNFATGFQEFIAPAKTHPKYTFHTGDNLDLPKLTAAMHGADAVLHLAANADVRFGLNHPSRDLEQNTIATFNVLEAMRANSVKRIGFSSTGSVYGECKTIPTPEDAPFPIQTSLYGASKLAGEGLIQAYCEGYGFHGSIFRFVSILGDRYTHGHVFDFYAQLKQHPDRLRILGNGKQRKSYLAIQDCVAAITQVLLKNAPAPSDKGNVQTFNLGTDEYCEVNDSVGWICEKMGVTPALEYSGGERGWVGDNPFIFLETKKIRGTGWKPKHSIRESVGLTVDWLSRNEWVFEKRT